MCVYVCVGPVMVLYTCVATPKTSRTWNWQCSWDAGSSICSPSPICPGNMGTRGHPFDLTSALA